MKTTFSDFVLIFLCITSLLLASGATVLLVGLSGGYRVLFDVLLFLLSYGLYSMLFLAVARKFKPYPIGRYQMDSFAFTYWKVNAVIVDLASKALAPFRTVFTEALLHVGFGGRFGSQVAIAGVLRDHPLLEIGNFATIGQNSVLTAHAITRDEIVIKPIRIGANAVVGINCVVMPGVELGEYAVLTPGAVAVVDTKIPAYEMWGGIPAKKIKDLPPN